MKHNTTKYYLTLKYYFFHMQAMDIYSSSQCLMSPPEIKEKSKHPKESEKQEPKRTKEKDEL